MRLSQAHRQWKSNILSMMLVVVLCLIPALNVGAQNDSTSVLASGKWVKISVEKEGIYQLTKDKLSAMGFKDPTKVKLYGYGLEVLPEYGLKNLDDDLCEIPLWRKDNGTLLFFGCGTTKWYAEDWNVQKESISQTAFKHMNNPYSKVICYFLTEDDKEPASLKKEVEEKGGTEVTTFPEHALIETDEFSYINSGRTFFEKYDFGGKATKQYRLNLPGYAGGAVKLDVCFSAAGNNSSSLSITANQARMGQLTFSKLAQYEYADVEEGSFVWKNAHADNDSIILTHSGTSGTAGHLDFIRASYLRKLSLTDKKFLVFRSNEKYAKTQQFTLNGAGSNTHIWRITKMSEMSEITGSLEESKLIFSATASRDDKFVAVNVDESYPEPAVVGNIQNQNLRSLKNIDLVIITPANGKLNEEAQRLADAHADHDSMKCVVVSADKVYNEFSSGTPDATAYRRFMKMLYDKGENTNSKPKNICLFGDAIWDNRMVTGSFGGLKPDDYLLCYESDNSVSHTDSYVLEEYFTILHDTEDNDPAAESPDCGVGRIAVKTVADAAKVVDKLIPYIYNIYAGAWRNTICMLADDGNRNIHMEDAEDINKQTEMLNPNMRIKKIYWDSYTRVQTATGNTYPVAYSDINKQMEEGALIMNYTGHGAAYCLSHEQVLKRHDFENWNSSRLPLWIHAACDVSPFDMDVENIGETALCNPKGGAMGVLSTTRTVYSTQNRTLNKLFMKHVLSSETLTIGEALQRAKSEINTGSYREKINKCHFVLLGDPAIRLIHAEDKLQINEFNGHEVTDKTDTIGAGSSVTVKGFIVDDNGMKDTSFNGIIVPTLFDCEENVTCKNNAGEDVQPYKFKQRNKTLYEAVNTVKNGEFEFTFIVPLDITYSSNNALITLYATSDDNQREFNGRFAKFVLMGTGDIKNDSIGPIINLILHDEGFTNNGAKTDEVVFWASHAKPQMPVIKVELNDTNGINCSGLSLGHDIIVALDNSPALTYTLNSNFQYDEGSHTRGKLEYTIPSLSVGTHTLLFRAWDIFNNSSSIIVTFDVAEDYDNVRIFDLAGHEIWNGNGKGYANTLPKGVYILKTSLETKKILIK